MWVCAKSLSMCILLYKNKKKTIHRYTYCKNCASVTSIFVEKLYNSLITYLLGERRVLDCSCLDRSLMPVTWPKEKKKRKTTRPYVARTVTSSESRGRYKKKEIKRMGEKERERQRRRVTQ